jgi:urease accessory protein
MRRSIRKPELTRATAIIIMGTTTMIDGEKALVEDHAPEPPENDADDTAFEVTSDLGGGAEVEAGLASLPLLIWLSPSFPVGSFAFSHGLEWAVQTGEVKDAESTIAWIGALLNHGAQRNDAILAASAWRAVRNADEQALREVTELALALAGSRERYLEATAQGNAFVTAIRTAWAAPEVDWAWDVLTGDVAYPIAVAVASAGHGFPLLATLEMLNLAVVQNLVSATIRLSALGHSDGQRVIAALLPEARKLAREAQTATLGDLGGAAFRSDIGAMSHETQYTRLFRS